MVDHNLAGWVLIHDGVELQQVQGTVTSVGNSGLDHRVTSSSQLDINHGVVVSSSWDRGSQCQRGAESGEKSSELHLELRSTEA